MAATWARVGTVSYQLTQADYRAFTRHAMTTALRAQALFMRVGAGMTLALGFWYWWRSIQRFGGLAEWWQDASLLALLIPVLAVAPLILVLVAPRVMASRLSSLPAAVGPHDFEWDDDRVRTRRPGMDFAVEWWALGGISATRDHIYFLLQGKGIVGAAIVPRSAFPSAADADAFLAESRRRWHAARAASAGAPSAP